MTSKTLYISDLDGTLFDNSGNLPEGTADVINGLTGRGMCFTFATARSPYTALPLTSRLRVNVPCVMFNGVLIYDTVRREYVVKHRIPEDSARLIAQAYKSCGTNCIIYKFVEGVLSACYSELSPQVMRDFAQERINHYGKPFVRFDDITEAADGDALFFTTVGERSKVEPVRDIVKDIPGVGYAFYEDTYTGAWYLEVFSSDATKAGGVRYLRERYGFDRVVVFGDNLNDLPMFEEADVRVAVANARPEVIAAADFTAPANTEDGVAEWLKREVVF